MSKNIISSIFGISPIRPMQEHMSKVHECVVLLKPFIETAIASDWDKVKEHRKNIGKLEREADTMKKKLRKKLPHTTFLPVPRAELLNLLSVQDGIANTAKDAVSLIERRKQMIPPSLAESLTTLTELAIEASAQAKTAINELDELIETGFRGKAVKLVERMLDSLDKIESKSDKCQAKSRARLQKLEAELPPIDVIFLYKLIDLLAAVADEAERVGSRLQILLAR